MMNKKGNMADWFVIIAVIALAGISLIACYMIVDIVDDVELFSNNADAQHVVSSAKNTLLNMDTMMLFIIVGLSLFVLLSSAVVFNHPAYFIIAVILLFIAVTLAAMISNGFWAFANSPTVAAAAAAFPKLTFLMNKLPIYVLFLGMATAIVMYISWRQN